MENSLKIHKQRWTVRALFCSIELGPKKITCRFTLIKMTYGRWVYSVCLSHIDGGL
jgi:hypothetical protein